MNYESIWLDGIIFDKPKQLNKNINVDVLIIGGGITGLSTAYHLIGSNLKICVVEKNIIAHAVSSRTTGKLTYLQEDIYSKLKDKANLYYESQKEAIEIVKDIIEKNHIDCNFNMVDSYVYIDQKDKIKNIKNEENILHELKIDYQSNNNLPIDISCNYAISVNDTAVFHPVKYLINLKKIIKKNGIPIYENSCVTSIEKKIINIFVRSITILLILLK